MSQKKITMAQAFKGLTLTKIEPASEIPAKENILAVLSIDPERQYSVKEIQAELEVLKVANSNPVINKALKALVESKQVLMHFITQKGKKRRYSLKTKKEPKKSSSSPEDTLEE